MSSLPARACLVRPLFGVNVLAGIGADAYSRVVVANRRTASAAIARTNACGDGVFIARCTASEHGDRTLDKPLICTIGHSNRSIEAFIELLRGNEIVRVLDVRTIPRSRHNPQFNQEALAVSLDAAQIAYAHLPGLGGLRHARSDSPNGGWRNLSFRGYADYMQSPEFAENVQRVADLADTERCVLMCAEAVPWRCHRSMIGDALLVRGFRVEDIIGLKGRKPHILTAFAHVDGTQITYPPPNDKADRPLSQRLSDSNQR